MRSIPASALLIAVGCGRVAFVPTGDARDDTTGCTGFGTLVHDSTELRNGRVVLSSGAAAGTVSSVCDAGDSRRWQALAPLPAAPYGKPLVTASETGYADAMLDATALVSHWAFEGSGVIANGATVAGSSVTTTAVNPDNAGTAYDTGIIGSSIHFDGQDSYLVGSLTGALGTSYTLVAWTSIDENASENHLVNPNNVQFFVEANANLRCGDGAGEFTTVGASTLELGRWYHTAFVQRATGWTLYLNGAPDLSGPQLVNALAGQMLIGEINPVQQPDFYAMNGRIDEAAIFARVLSDTELVNLYKRGALTLAYEARTCDALPCTGSFARFSEASNTAPTPPRFDLSALPAGRYLEWRATLQSDSVSPELVDITVE